MPLTYWFLLCSVHMWSFWRYTIFLWSISFLGVKAGQGRLFFPLKDALDELDSKSCLFSLYQNLSQAGDLSFCSMWRAAISSHQVTFRSVLSEGFSCVAAVVTLRLQFALCCPFRSRSSWNKKIHILVFVLSAWVNGIPIFVQSVTSSISGLIRIESLRIMSVLWS